MKILHLSKYYHPFKGGIEKVIQELAEESVRLGHQVTVVCSSETYRRHDEMVNGVRVIRLPKLMSLFSQPLTPSLFFELKRWILESDVVQIHTPNPLMESVYLSLKVQKPLIITHHCDVFKKTPINGFYQKVFNQLMQIANRIVVSTPYHIVCSPTLQPFKDKIMVIPFGIKQRWNKNDEKIKNKVEMIHKKHPDYFLFIGRMVGYKGVDVLLKAMQRVPIPLYLIGKGPLLEKWKKLSAELQLENKVYFLNEVVDDDDFASYICGARALVLPSVSEAEAFGMVLLEAMAFGVPVITTQLRSGVQYVNQSGETGLAVAPKDPVALAVAMNLMHSNKIMRNQMGHKAQLRFEGVFTLDQFVSSYFSLYEEIIVPQNLEKVA